MKPELNKKSWQTGTMSVRDNSDGTFELSVCSDKPYMRPFGLEILSCNPGAVDMERFDLKSVPLIWGHNTDLPALGIVESFRLDGSKGIATVRFTESNELARNTKAAVVDGTQRNVSIGYMVDEWVELPTGDTPAYVATRYTIFEVSIVTVPADPTVGFARENATVTAAYRDFLSKSAAPEPVIEPTTDSATLIIEDSTERSAVDPDEDGDDDECDSDTMDCPDEDEEEEMKDGYEEEKSLATAPQTPPTKATVMEKSMSDENKNTAFEELTAWAVAAKQTDNLVRWMKEGFTLDRAKAEAFDAMSNAPKVNIPVDVRSPEKITKADADAMSLTRAFNAVARKGSSELMEEGADYARKMNIEIAPNEAFIPLDKAVFKRTMGFGAAPGLNFTGTEYLTAEAALREGSVVGRAGVQIVTGVNSLLTLPRVTTGSAFAWQSETGSISDVDFTSVLTTWSPKVAATSIAWSIPLDTLNQPYAMEDIARQDLMAAVIEAFEGGVLAGTGASNQPTGLINDGGLTLVHSGSGGNFDQVRAGDMWAQQRGQKGSQANFTYIVTPKVFAGAQTRIGATGFTVSGLQYTGPGEATINGYRVLNSNYMTTALYANACVAGDFSKVLSAVFGIKIIRDDWNGLPNTTVKLRGILMMDSKARQPFNLVRDVNITG